MTKGLLRVLIADDDEAIRNLNAMLVPNAFPEYEVRVDCVSDGIELYERAKKKEYDLGITDINMPYMTGPIAIRKLRAEGINFRTLVITGLTDDKNLRETDELGLSYLAKPYSPNAFMKALQSVWAKPSFTPIEGYDFMI